jgi:hypothetical protein
MNTWKVWKDDWSVNNRNNEILNNEYLTAIFEHLLFILDMKEVIEL